MDSALKAERMRLRDRIMLFVGTIPWWALAQESGHTVTDRAFYYGESRSACWMQALSEAVNRVQDERILPCE